MSEIWITFDSETDGLVDKQLVPLNRQPHIIEFAALLATLDADGNSEELASLDFICDPGVVLSEVIERVTGLKTADVQGKPKFTTYADDVAEMFAKATHRAAHNITFDESMLDFEFARIGKEWRPRRQRRVCTVEETEHMFGRRASLSDLHERLFGGRFEGAHRAMVDVRANWRCVVQLRKDGVI